MNSSCINCDKQIPEKSKYCPYCGYLQNCKACGEDLIKEAMVCHHCGIKIGEKEPLTDANDINPINSIEFIENNNERKFKATFSDTIGENISQAFGNIIEKRFNYNNEPEFGKNQLETEDEEAGEVTDYEEITDSNSEMGKSESVKAISEVQVFERDNKGDLRLLQTDLKADSKFDYGKRLSLLFLHYSQLEFDQEVDRKEINNMLKKVTVHDNNIIGWLGKTHLFSKNGKKFKLSIPGKEEAKSIIAQLNDPTYKGKWNISMLGKSGSSKKNTSSSTGFNFQIVQDLDLYPSKKDSFAEFIKNYQLNRNPARILASVYYLEKIMKLDLISYNHIYTCLKEFKISIPPSLYSVINNVRRRNKYIENSSKGCFRVSMRGLNELEHNLKKN